MDVIIWYVFAVLILLIFSKLIFKSIGVVIKILINALVGGAIIWLLNIFGLGVTLNWLTALIVGFLGVPGVIVVLILQFAFHII